MSQEFTKLIAKTNELIAARSPFVQITMVNARGSAPQIVGAKALVDESGLVEGTIGGGKVEMKAIAYAQDLLKAGAPNNHLLTWNLQTDVGMTCGGEVQFFFEVFFSAEWTIAVFGAGHVAQELVRQLLHLNCRIHCFDSRAEWLEKVPEDSRLNKVLTDSPKDQVRGLPAQTFFVLMSQGHATDLPVLAEVLQTRKAPYIGVIGSKQKALVLKRDLEKIGVDKELRESFYCPMGLPIGNNTPAEIALSISAQLLQVRGEYLYS